MAGAMGAEPQAICTVCITGFYLQGTIPHNHGLYPILNEMDSDLKEAHQNMGIFPERGAHNPMILISKSPNFITSLM